MGPLIEAGELGGFRSFRIYHGDQSLSMTLFAFSNLVLVDIITHLKWSLYLHTARFTLFYRINNGLQFLL